MSKIMPSKAVVAELAATGVLRTGINLSNFLLVTGTTAAGDPVGVAPDMALEIANRLGVPVKYHTFKTPAELADQALNNVWDIGLIGAEPQRAAMIAFSPAYVEIESTYLVPSGSPLMTIADVDKPGIRIAVTGKTAYGLWLDNNIKHASLHRSGTFDTAFAEFRDSKLDALAGLRPGLIKDLANMPGSRLIAGRFSAVQQAIGTQKKNTAAAAFLRDFAEEVKKSGFVQSLIDKHKVVGLTVAPPAA
jgi:polar amino acid transport system substrate-binding protein